MGHPISADTVRSELTKLGFSRQHNRKADEGARHPDRNAQFEYINAKVKAAQAAGQPVISVDTKKKELVGNYKNAGSDYRPKGSPHRVKVHDFEDKELGKVAPYGIYDVTANVGFVNVGVTSDTAEFAVQSIRTWRQRMGLERHPNMRELTITADCGGSNGARVRLWKVELHKFAGNCQRCHLSFADLDALLVGACIEHAFDFQAGLRRRGADQLDDGYTIHKRFSAPVLSDVAEQAVFDLIPFRG